MHQWETKVDGKDRKRSEAMKCEGSAQERSHTRIQQEERQQKGSHGERRAEGNEKKRANAANAPTLLFGAKGPDMFGQAAATSVAKVRSL